MLLKFISKNFVRNCAGNVAVMFSLALVPVLGCIGAAIDYSHVLSARTEVQAALDASVLAGAGRFAETQGDQSKALSAAQDAFKSAVGNRTDLMNNSIVFKINSAKTGLIGTGSADLNTTFLKFVGIQTLPVMKGATASAEISSGGSGGNIEIAMMLDVTGSMCANGSGPCTSGTKLSGVKAAASQLVDKVVWADQSTYTSKLSIVPFNDVVRVGPDGGGAATMKKLTNLDATWSGYYKECTSGSGSGGTGEGGQNWNCTAYQTSLVSNWKVIPCVTDRYFYNPDRFDLSDSAPTSDLWLNGNDGERFPKSHDSSDTAMTSGIGTTAADASTAWNYEAAGTCDSSANANEILPLTNDKSALKSKISGLVAQGGTGGALGTAMAWYTISPNWSSIWPSGSSAGSYSDLTATNDSGGKKLRKIAILMSDGGYNAYRGWIDQSHVPIVTTGAKAFCESMKAKGIEIFTVAYDLDNLTTAEASSAIDTLKSCGTDVQHFYNSLDAGQLAAAFGAIGTQISSGGAGIRLTQ